ncbi:hypothetical protein EDB85DRAFT_1542726 [Lactarius pseudohatsudake]|nr:hypothetical protein EDB85DRAFT_1542726 [Lactarius pseudohatsudake]
MAYYDTYRDQLASLYHGHALWVPEPSGLYDHVRVGDVGYVKQGHFNRMFNALLPADDLAQVYGVPKGFVPLNMGPFNNIRTLNLTHGDYCSNTVTVEHEDRHQAGGPGEGTSASFRCRRNKGAFLSLPFNANRADTIRTKAFETYIRKHYDSWLRFAIVNDLDVRLEDIILVTGCDLTSSWAMAAFVNSWDPEITLSVHASRAGGARFQWSVTNQPHNNETKQNVEKSHCVFIRGFRAKQILPSTVAVGPPPDNPDSSDSEPESSIELLREPTTPGYRDPLIGILDYIAEQRPDQELALAHEDDLRMIGVVVRTNAIS